MNLWDDHNLNYIFNKSKLLLIFFVLLVFVLGYGIFELSINDGDLLVGSANPSVQECGCSKCHTIMLNGCSGCHNSQQNKQRTNESPSGPGGSNDSESASPEGGFGSQESQSKEPELPKSDLDETINDSEQKSETVPNKSKNQKGSDNSSGRQK